MSLTLTVPFAVDEPLAAWVAEACPGYTILGRANKKSLHPKLHIERLVAEAMVVNLFRGGGRVLDVGGAVSRHRVFRRHHVHSCCPVLTGQDYVRNKKYRAGGSHDFCEHRVQDCRCIDADKLMMIHSIYYFEPLDVLKLARRYLQFYFVCHDFVGSGGAFHDEAEFQVHGSHVMMSVKGASFGYTHSTCPWVLAGGYDHFWYGQVIFNKMTSVGTTHIYSANYSRLLLPRDYPVMGNGAKMWCDLVRDKAANDVVVLECGTAVPLALINKLFATAFITNKNLEAALFQQAELFLKTWRSRTNSYNYLDTLGISVSYVLANHEKLKRRYAADVTRRSNIDLNSRQHWLIRVRNWIVCCGSSPPQITRVMPELVADTQPLDSDTPPEEREALLCADSTTSGTSSGSGGGGRVKIWGEHEVSRRDGRAVHNYASQDVVTPPIVFNQDEDAIRKSLHGRAFAPVAEVDSAAFEEFEGYVRKHMKLLFPSVAKKFKPTPFQEWNRRFPPGSRALHEAARDDLLVKPLTHEDCTVRSAFLKSEVSFDNSHKPARLIQAGGNRFKVAVGPYLHGLSKIVCQSLSGDDFYAPGKTTLEIGEFYRATEFSVATDMRRFDSSVRRCHMMIMCEVFEYFNFPSWVMVALRQSIDINGYFSGGLRYSTDDPRMTSGHPWTTVLNTLLNLFAHKWACWKAGINHPRICVGGDDALVQGVPDSAFALHLVLLGFDCAPVECPPGRGEFYSSIFLPSTLGVVLTPKLGRCLRKLGLTTVRRDNPKSWLRGVVQAYMAVFSHVEPMLRILTRWDSQLSEVNPTYYTLGLTAPVEKPEASPDTLTALYEYYGCGPGAINLLVEEYLDLRSGDRIASNVLGDLLARE